MILGFLVLLLVAVAGIIWTMVLFRTSQPASASSGSTAPAFFDYPSEPASGSGVVFAFLIGKPMSLQPNTMECTSPVDFMSFWNTYRAAINAGRDDMRRQAVTTALAASCKITQATEFGVIVDDMAPDQTNGDEWVVYQSNDDGNKYIVQAASVNP